MSAHLAYPATRYEPAPLIDLSDRAERERLSGAALTAFFAIMQRWKIRDEDARRLLGTMSNGSFYDLKKDHSRVLDEDRLQRVSYLVGVFKALNIVYGEALADRWMDDAQQQSHLRRRGAPRLSYSRRIAGLPDAAAAARCAPGRDVTPRLTALNQNDTCRLIPSKYNESGASVLSRLTTDEKTLAEILDLDHATNDRLLAESEREPGIARRSCSPPRPAFVSSMPPSPMAIRSAAASMDRIAARGTPLSSWKRRKPRSPGTKPWNWRRSAASPIR